MSQKMPIFPKKTLKMPGWQHWTSRGQCSSIMFFTQTRIYEVMEKEDNFYQQVKKIFYPCYLSF